MRRNLLILTMFISLNSLWAQNLNNDLGLFNTTWKAWSHEKIADEFACNGSKATITDERLLILPQCDNEDRIFKILFVSDKTLVLEKLKKKPIKKRRKIVGEKLVPTGKFFYFKNAHMDALEYHKMEPDEKVCFMRLDS